MLQLVAKCLRGHQSQQLRTFRTGAVCLRRKGSVKKGDINKTSHSSDSDTRGEAQNAPCSEKETVKQYNGLFWPPVSSERRLDLTKTYVKRYVSEHFDTVIDPQFGEQTGLPMTIYISQKQDYRPASIEVHQYYGRFHNLSDIFTMTIPRSPKDSPRIIGDTGAITMQDIAKVCEFIELNRNMLLEVWENGEDARNDLAWRYYKYINRVIRSPI